LRESVGLPERCLDPELLLLVLFRDDVVAYCHFERNTMGRACSANEVRSDVGGLIDEGRSELLKRIQKNLGKAQLCIAIRNCRIRIRIQKQLTEGYVVKRWYRLPYSP
jgi:hypothetical protein